MQNSTINLVDLSNFTSGDRGKRDDFIQSLGESFRNIGFARVRSELPTTEDWEAIYEELEAFFALPTEIKEKYIVPGGAGQRGYTRFGMETAQGETLPDLKEFWHFGQYDPILQDMLANLYVDELPRFNQLGRQIFKELEEVAFLLLEAIALYLRLEPSFFAPWSRGGDSILRAIHYPPLTEGVEGTRAAAHTDINLITLLITSKGAGLEARDRMGNWVPVNAGSGELIVNVGDMLSRLTNDYLPSTMHRVVNPTEERSEASRYSLPFFMHPHPSMPLNVLETYCTEEVPARYPPITSGEFLDQRLRELGLKL